MKLIGIALIAALTGSLAQADGYVCESTQGNVRMKMYNYATVQEDQRFAIIVVSDPRMPDGDRFIARFANARSNTNNSAAVYEADVDFETSDLADDVDSIGNTPLDQLSKVAVKVDFSYGKPVVDGEYVPGSLFLTRRDGAVEFIELDCERYLKH